jgi:hypothetical protein
MAIPLGNYAGKGPLKHLHCSTRLFRAEHDRIFGGKPHKQLKLKLEDKRLKFPGESAGCPHHTEYQAKRQPQCNCQVCWRIWRAQRDR